MSSGSDRRLSLDELKALNPAAESADDSSMTNTPTEIKVECTISPELAEELIGLMELTVRELWEIEGRLGRLPTEEERKKDRQQLERIATAIEQAGKRNERRFSLACFVLWLSNRSYQGTLLVRRRIRPHLQAVMQWKFSVAAQHRGTEKSGCAVFPPSDRGAENRTAEAHPKRKSKRHYFSE